MPTTKRTTKAAAPRKAAASSNGGKGGYAAGQVRRAFAPVMSMSDAPAAAIAKGIGSIDGIGDLAPDDAARRVQAAVRDATGQTVSIDASLNALMALNAERNAEGDQVGGEGDAPAGAATATSSGRPDEAGGTATGQASGGTSTGTATAGGTAGPGGAAQPGD